MATTKPSHLRAVEEALEEEESSKSPIKLIVYWKRKNKREGFERWVSGVSYTALGVGYI